MKLRQPPYGSPELGDFIGLDIRLAITGCAVLSETGDSSTSLDHDPRWFMAATRCRAARFYCHNADRTATVDQLRADNVTDYGKHGREEFMHARQFCK